MTSFVVPTYQPPAASGGWSVVDRFTRTYTATADSTGVATITGPQLDPNRVWSLEHMVCFTGSTAAAQFRLYETTVDPSTLLDGSTSGNFDVADWPAGLLVQPSQQLVAQWTGADPGARCTLRLQTTVLDTGT